MGLFQNYFVDVKRGTKITYSESDLRKLDRTYEKEVFPQERKKILSSFRKVPQQAYLTQVRDYAFEKILDNHMYTFQHILVIPNPYDIVRQSALLLFNSSQETKVRYRVLGDTPEADFVGETDYTKRHRVPVLGLYANRNNDIELEMSDAGGTVIKRRKLRIYVPDLAKKDAGIQLENNNKKMSQFPFIMVSGLAFDPIVTDCNGAIRYSIQLRSKRIGMIPLVNGHFLYEDRTVNRMEKNGQYRPCRYHEMDYLGRVYRTFLVDFPVKGVAGSQGDSLYLYTTARKKGNPGQVAELNLQNGQIVYGSKLPEIDKDNLWGKICHPVSQRTEKEKESSILSEDGSRYLLCADLRKKQQGGRKFCLEEVDSSTGETLRSVYFYKVINMAWLFKPDILEFCKPVALVEDVIFGTIAPPEEFQGILPAEVKEPIDRMYFGGIRLCGDLFVSFILPGRIDRVYFVGEKHSYMQNYEGMKVGKVRVSFAISMAEFAVDEYSIFVESRGVVHRLKNKIRVVE